MAGEAPLPLSGVRVLDFTQITLGPIATVLGLAFKLHDPDHLIGDRDDGLANRRADIQARVDVVATLAFVGAAHLAEDVIRDERGAAADKEPRLTRRRHVLRRRDQRQRAAAGVDEQLMTVAPLEERAPSG